ncbi:protein MCM10 homolog [Halyomorpha halys]|uniref:protein MCM10 homolog n=1 Tax=Halyomorpha halys TaxID=286706 RepID=UPI0006D526B9|nr:protein MCM10 homolog [Halyomorpha halys]
MDDDFDILALAIESVEQEAEQREIKPLISPLSKTSKDSNIKNSSQGANDSKSPEVTPKTIKGRSFVGVDLCFEENIPVDAQETVLVKPRQKDLFPEKSVVHTGDTDSSDDEGNKYFDEVKYDSFGKFVKNKLKNTGNQLTSYKNSSWKKNKTDSLSPATSVKVAGKETKVDVSADPIFGIRIINPVVSSQVIKEKMIGRTPIGFAKIKYHVSYGDLNNDWVIAAVIVKKLPPRVSQNGNNYSSWIISDLKSDLKTVFLFLFGRAHQELWKTSPGTVLAILNPSVLKNDNDKKSEYEAKLSIKSPDQVMVWGKSKDLGQCKVTKKNGEMCGTFVNSYLCEVCVYHVKQEYNKCNSKTGRPEFSSSGNVNLRNKVLGKNEVFYAGKSFTSVNPPSRGNKKNTAQDVSRLQGLGRTIAKVPEIVSIPNLQRSNEILKLLPSVKNPLNSTRTSDKSRLDQLNTSHSNNESGKHLKQDELGMKNHTSKKCSAENAPNKSNLFVPKLPTLTNPEKEFSLIEKSKSSETRPIISPLTEKSSEKIIRTARKSKANLQKRFNSLVGMQSEIKEENNHGSIKCNTMSNSTEKRVPIQSNKNSKGEEPNILKDSSNAGVPSTPRRIANSSKKSLTINDENNEFSDLPSEKTLKNDISTNKIESPRTSLNAGSYNSPTPNSKMSRAKMKALMYVKANGPISKEDASKAKTEGKTSGVKRPYPSEDDEENKKSVLSERFIQLMNQKSLHEDLIELREYEQEMEYFDKMEKKDRLEEKMLNTYKVDCKAVKCLKCNYLWFSASDACKAEGHPLKVIDAVKRFFKCGNCENRTVSLTIIPLLPCKKCSGSNWVRTAMMKEKIAKNDSLSIRGGEQKFVNSVITNAGLNLLVPD